MSGDKTPSAYVEALAEERAMYARSAGSRSRVGMVDEDLAAHGWAVDKTGKLVDVALRPVVPVVDPSVPRAHKERAVAKPNEKAVDPN